MAPSSVSSLLLSSVALALTDAAVDGGEVSATASAEALSTFFPVSADEDAIAAVADPAFLSTPDTSESPATFAFDSSLRGPLSPLA